MNIFRGIQLPSWLHQRPNPRTQSLTASGQWTTTEPTKQLPGPSREIERQTLRLAAESGRLAIRQIEPSEVASYFDDNGTPRSCTLALQGVPPGDLTGRWTVGIVDPDCLYVYKQNSGAWPLKQGAEADKLDVKLLSDLQSLAEKDKEIQEQAGWEVYDRFTSGHLGADGKFSLPKLKPGKYDSHKAGSVYSSGSVPCPQLVVTNNGKADIKCFFVTSNVGGNISDILQKKRECEQALSLPPLPLVVFCCETGCAEVCYDDELDSEHLALIEDSLDCFDPSGNISIEIIMARMKLLPMHLQAEALRSGFSIPPDDQHKWQQAIELVSNPCAYSGEKLLALKESGLPIHRCFFHEGKMTSLLDLFLFSEIERYNAHDRATEFRVDEVDPLLRLLLKSGAILTAWGQDPIRQMGGCTSPSLPPYLFNYMVAAFGSFKFLTLQNLWNIPLTGCSGGIVEFDRICKKYDHRQRQICLIEILSRKRFYPNLTLDTVKSHLLALFRCGAIPDKEVMDSFKRDLKTYHHDDAKLIDNLSVAGYIEWVEELWKKRETYTLYQNWPAHVEEANQQIAKLKQSLDLPVDRFASVTPALQFMVDAFSKPPVLPDNVGDNEDTILKVLQHYYRRPGPERVMASLYKFFPKTWKEQHSCSHALRARNNGLWYMELLERCQVHSFNPVEKSLLPLAIIYQNAAAEDVDKSAEKTRSAVYFKQDLAGHFPEKLLDEVALAIVNMENDIGGKADQNLTETVRWYLRILRFAVHMDFIRYFVEPEFPGLATQPQFFNTSDLDLPHPWARDFTSEPDHKTEFQRHLEAAMHGAADLVQLTTTSPRDRRKNPYTEVYGLVPDSKKITLKFDRTAEPVQGMDRFIDDNVRRKIAKQAGIITCSDPSHKTCKADQNKGITYGIHNSWYDLRQVRVPAAMTLLEKMQFEHDPSLLSPATLQAIEEEVQRLKSEGIRMNTGTLTQETLDSEKAQKVLEDRGITVISEQRRHFGADGFPKEREMLVPKKIAKPD
ncbi:hypothetical protein [Endozoicomonas sp. 8E]|uniref:hypothetical protein n=1 Tax=Endozoicomonas sp. 8E TaxID=3035692 RepID=UPI002938DB9F|nr:hypothetical protein [Endozoicomonas sp. 8E]WOG29126.1 hypothetical protein P6910_05530 [Endozoicomonas sp. 8E]